jgi:TetR/AcrR family transcriptional regulator
MSLAKLTCPIKKALHAKRERRKEARPGELLDAALDLFVEKGFAATRAEEVAARAGVSKGTLFLYFQSKEDLFKAVVRENISGHIKAFDAAFDSFDGSSGDMVAQCMRTWWQGVGVTKTAGIDKLMASEAGNFPDLAKFYQQEVIEPGQALTRRILQRGIDRGEFKPMDLDYAVYSIIAPMMFLIMTKNSPGVFCSQSMNMNPEKYIDTLVTTMLYGMSTTPRQQKLEKPG